MQRGNHFLVREEKKLCAQKGGNGVYLDFIGVPVLAFGSDNITAGSAESGIMWHD